MGATAPSGAREFSIFVGDLPYEATDAEVVEFFRAAYPSCVGAHVVTDSATGKSRGYGFVRFTDAAEQARALAEMGGKQFGSRVLRVGPATPKPDQRRPGPASTPSVPLPSGAPQGGADMGQGGLPSAHASMQAGAWGPGPAASGTALPPYSGAPTGYGGGAGYTAPGGPGPAAGATPTAGPAAADPARAALVAAVASTPFAPAPAVSEGNTTVFVGGLDKHCSEAELRFHFHRCGPVSSVKVLTDKGCGFVQFQFRAHAEAAIASLNGSVLGIGPLRLQWGKNAARNAMAAQATLPGGQTPSSLPHSSMMGHQHVGYGNTAYVGGLPLAGMGGAGAVPPFGAVGGMPMAGLASHGSGGLPGMFAPLSMGVPLAAPGVPGGVPPAASLGLGMPGLPGAGPDVAGVNTATASAHALPLVSTVHNPWSFGNPESKGVGGLWGGPGTLPGELGLAVSEGGGVPTSSS